MKKNHLLLITVMAVLILLAGSASAWVGSASSQVVAVDDQASCSQPYGRVCSLRMGDVRFADYSPQSFTRVAAGSLTAASLSGKDTVFLFGVNPTSLADQTALVNFVNNGGKLIIWDGEDACPATSGMCTQQSPGQFGYSWLGAFQFTSYAPGAHGAEGFPLSIDEDNQLSSNTVGSPFRINVTPLGQNTDAVGDSNIFTGYSAGHWCLDMTATNTLNFQGPVHLYTKDFGTGIVIYSGLDWDDASDYAGYRQNEWGAGNEMKRMLQNELNAYSLPCTKTPGGTLTVEKTADKPTYNVGETITFTITVTNPSSYTSYRTSIVDTPPTGVTCPQPADIGTLGPNAVSTTHLVCTAMIASCTPVKNEVTATGWSDPTDGVPVFIGSDDVEFTIVDSSCNPPAVPEFPTLALPVGMLLGMMFIIYLVKKKE